MISRKSKQLSERRYGNNISQHQDALSDPMFHVGENLKAEFDMWSWIYQEISNIRLEVSRLGTFVRINNPQSPGFLNAYHAHIYSLLVPISVAVGDRTWNAIENKWLETKNDIEKYFMERKANPNKKIPFELIRKLDRLYRVALLVAQKAGLGFKITQDHDVSKAIEDAIATG